MDISRTTNKIVTSSQFNQNINSFTIENLVIVLIICSQIVLASMHKYQPRIHVIRTADLTQIPWAPQQAFIFSETEFVAVTAYQVSGFYTYTYIILHAYVYRQPKLKRGKTEDETLAYNSSGIISGCQRIQHVLCTCMCQYRAPINFNMAT